MRCKKMISALSAVVMCLSCLPALGANAECLRGDANGDGKVTVSDAALIARSLISKNVKMDREAADYDCDGKVTARDAATLTRDIAMGTVKQSVPESKTRSMPETKSVPESKSRSAAVIDVQSEGKGRSVGEPEISEEVYAYAQEALELVNRERAKVGADPLTLNTTMILIANERAVETSEFFSHTRPNGEDFSTMFDKYQLDYYFSGENIAGGCATPAVAVVQWIKSEGHYRNMIDPEYTEMGLGYYYNENTPYKTYWVQLFKK